MIHKMIQREIVDIYTYIIIPVISSRMFQLNWWRQQPNWNLTLNKRLYEVGSECRVELMAWKLNWWERLNRIQQWWVQIPLRSTFYSYFKEFFSGEYHMCHSFCNTHVIISSKFQLKQTWRLMKAKADMKLDIEQTMKLE